MTVRLSEEAKRGWDLVCRRHGVNMTALMEAFGLEMLEHGLDSEPQTNRIVERARQIEAERRGRR